MQCMHSTHHIIVVRTPSTERMARLDGDGCELGELGSLRLMMTWTKEVLAVDGRKFENSAIYWGQSCFSGIQCCLWKELVAASVMCLFQSKSTLLY